MIGEHPWNQFSWIWLGPTVRQNTSSGAVVPLAIDGLTVGGQITENSASGAQGTNGFGTCSFSANYTAAHYGMSTIDPGSTYHEWDNPLCTQ